MKMVADDDRDDSEQSVPEQRIPEQADKTVVFADLTGSTKLFESQGNTIATNVVTRCTQMLGSHFTRAGGRVVKFLGDGLLVLFDQSDDAVEAASHTRDVLYECNMEHIDNTNTPLGLKVGIEFGLVIEQHGDCYGDAVNVAARLGDRAEANEILLGESLYSRLPESMQMLCTGIDRIAIRGKAGLFRVWRFDLKHSAETTITGPSDLLGERLGTAPAQRADIDLNGRHMQLLPENGALVIGRSESCGLVIDDRRVSRRHARIEWVGGQCTLTDFSTNGTWVKFGREAELVILKRDNCVLHGYGMVGLGGIPRDYSSSSFSFHIISDEE
ncbi:MAG: adenylate/guanylate cyclase domain-containing protein [Azoarcus sp.]|jgi:class 3 adenylate cyclase|nr:adenylate/guanylate cyclase domain-containing protein [Azoarcus sp.]